MSDLKTHQKAINGFVFWVLTWVGFIMFIVWSTSPEDLLHRFQFTYYPDRYWAVALPAIVSMFFLYYVIMYYLSSLRNTKPLTSAFCITDQDARQQGKTSLGGLSDGNGSSIPPIADIPVNVVSRVLHQPWK